MSQPAGKSESWRLSQATGIEPGRLQYLEKSFPEWLDIAGRGSEVLDLEEDGAALLRWMHDLIFVQGRTVEWVRNALLAANGGLRFIAISSGKGGVGKTTCSVNLAFAMATLGLRVLLVDADLGLGNVHVFAGINPSVTMMDFLDHQLPLAATLCPVAENLWALCGGSGASTMANLDSRRLSRLLRHLRGLGNSMDVVLLDTGAGLSPQVLGFLAQAQEIVVVTTPNIAATLDAYGLLKTIHEKGMSGRVRLLVNQASGEAEAVAVSNKIAACAGQFLQTAPEPLGFLTREDAIEQANQQRHPFVSGDSASENSRRLFDMARELTRHLLPPAIEPFADALETSTHHASV